MLERFMLAAAVLTASGAGGPAGFPGAAAAAQRRATFSAESELVVLHVTVTDPQGRYVEDLPREAFRVVEDGRPQQVSVFSDRDAPMTIGLVVDSSGSMLSSRDRVLYTASAFAEMAGPRDELFAIAFSDGVTSALPASAPFTNDVMFLREMLARVVTSRGRTALYDGLSEGLDYVANGANLRRVLVVVSDGGDNASRTTFDRLLSKTQASNALVYAIGFVDPLERNANPAALRRIAEASGGEAFSPRDSRRVLDILTRVARAARSAYTLGYVSTNPERDGAYRRVRVAVDAPDGRRFTVRTRSGYLARTRE
jgi:Ca-activated chloride channel family protein